MKLSQNSVAWNNNKHLLSHAAFVGQKSRSSLGWVFLAQDLSWNHSQDFGWDCYNLKICLGLEGPLPRWLSQRLDKSYCWLLAEGSRSLPYGWFHRAAWVGSQHGSWHLLDWVIQEKARRKPLRLLWPRFESHAPPFLHYFFSCSPIQEHEN